MKIQEVKIDGVVYVASETMSCRKCALKGKKCSMGYFDGENICICVVFKGRAFKKKDENTGNNN